MATPRFLQIHTLHSYPAALLNRDNSGLAKRLSFGGTTRTRISSQCLKRHWRMAEDEFSLKHIDGFTGSIRSRNAVSLGVMQPLKDAHAASAEVLQAIERTFEANVYSNSGTQPLLLGLPEVEYLRDKAAAICKKYPNDQEKAVGEADLLFNTAPRSDNEERDNFSAFRENTRFPGGLISALFGRMVTSDTAANMDAAIHVAHAFTVHGGESEKSEMDFWAAVEDLPRKEEGPGAAHLDDMELAAGLFYGYVVVDVPGLVSNLEGCKPEEWEDEDRELASKVVHNLIHLIAKVSPGAKRGPTAPYERAGFMLIEAGTSQPRSLANAFRNPVNPLMEDAVNALSEYLAEDDEMYDTGEVRCFASRRNCTIHTAQRIRRFPDLATWAADAVRNGTV